MAAAEQRHVPMAAGVIRHHVALAAALEGMVAGHGLHPIALDTLVWR